MQSSGNGYSYSHLLAAVSLGFSKETLCTERTSSVADEMYRNQSGQSLKDKTKTGCREVREREKMYHAFPPLSHYTPILLLEGIRQDREQSNRLTFLAAFLLLWCFQWTAGRNSQHMKLFLAWMETFTCWISAQLFKAQEPFKRWQPSPESSLLEKDGVKISLVSTLNHELSPVGQW